MIRIKYEDKMFIYDRIKYISIKYYFLKIKLFFLSIYYKRIIRKHKSIKKKKRYEFSICSIFKNEAPFLKEFIEYHMLIGFEHFYFYNNNSDDKFQNILDPYIQKGIVTLDEWPLIPGQPSCYQHFYENYRHETTWVSFLDLDEFFVPKKVTTIKEWIKPYEDYPTIMIYWKMFGTNGALNHDKTKLLTEQYINSWDKLTDIGKLLYNTNYEIPTFFLGMMHAFDVRIAGVDIPPINQFGYFVKYNIHRFNKQTPTIQLNHYWSKSYENYLEKHKRGSASFVNSWKTFDKFLWHEHFNISCDFSIYRYIIELKLKMSGEYPLN